MFAKAAFSTVLFLAVAAVAQSPATQARPCSRAEFRQLDFWVGEWSLTWPAAKAGQPEGQGTNSIRKELGNCVIEENFHGGAMGLTGKSVSMYNARSGKWQQTWVDNQGGYLDFVGGWEGKQMVLSREAVNPQGQKVLQRMVYKNITHGSFDWSWERSIDEGKNWQVVWPIHYVRKKGQG